MIYHCPDCGIYWYILNEYLNKITWKTLGSLLFTDPSHVIERPCPNHDTNYSQSAGVHA